MMGVLKITSNNFEDEVLNSNKMVLIDFFAEWCGPCKMMAPIIDEIAKEHENMVVGKVNVDENQEIAVKYNIMSIPTLIFFKNGEIKEQLVGMRSKDELNDIISKLSK